MYLCCGSGVAISYQKVYVIEIILTDSSHERITNEAVKVLTTCVSNQMTS